MSFECIFFYFSSVFTGFVINLLDIQLEIELNVLEMNPLQSNFLLAFLID